MASVGRGTHSLFPPRDGCSVFRSGNSLTLSVDGTIASSSLQGANLRPQGVPRRAPPVTHVAAVGVWAVAGVGPGQQLGCGPNKSSGSDGTSQVAFC